jgi:hypothetical protein
MTMRERTVSTFRADSPELRAEVVRRLRGIQDAVAELTDDLHEAMEMMAQCDGDRDGEACILAWHQGYHRSASGAEWLDS